MTATASMTIPHLLALAIVAMLNQFCYLQLAEAGADPDDDACITTLSNIFYRADFRQGACLMRRPTWCASSSRVGLPDGGAGRCGRAPMPGSLPPALPASKPKVAMIATHYQIDFSEHYLADYMAARGIGFLGWNTRFRGFESSFLLDHALVDIGVGVRWLREVAGVQTVVLLGNSGGGSLMAAYQSQAVDPNVTPLRGMRPAAGLNDLSPLTAMLPAPRTRGAPKCSPRGWTAPSSTRTTRWQPIPKSTSSTNATVRRLPPNSSRSIALRRRHATTPSPIGRRANSPGCVPPGFSDRPFTVMRTWADPRMVDPSIEPTSRQPNTCYAGVPVKANRSARGIAAATHVAQLAGACGASGMPRPAPSPTWPESGVPRW